MGFLSNASFSALDKVTTAALRLGAIWIVANALGAEGQGQLALMRTVWLSGYALFSLGMDLSNNFLAARADHPDELPRLTGNLLLCSLTLPAIPSSIVWLVAGTTDYFGVVGNLGLWLSAGIWCQFLLAGLRGTLQGRGEFRMVFAGSAAQHAMVLLALGALWQWDRLTLDALAAVWVSGVLLACAIYFSRVLSLARYRLRVHLPTLKAQLSYGGHAYMNNLMTAANLRVDTYLIKYFLPFEALGYYSLATVIAEIVVYLPSAFTRAILTQVSAHQSLGRGVFRNLSGFSLLLAAGIAVATPFFIPILFPDFLDSIFLVWILLPGCYLFGMAQIFCYYQMGKGRVRIAARAAFFGLLATVLGNLVLLPSIGAFGAAAASVFSYSLYFAILYKSIAQDEPISLAPSFGWVRLLVERWRN